MIKFPYTKAVLNDCNKDLKKRWSISFWVYSVDKGDKVRKYDYSVNKFNTVAERRIYARRRIEAINSLLEKGFHIDSSKKAKLVEENPYEENDSILQKEFYTIKQATKYALSICNVSHASKVSYDSNERLFIEWCKIKGIADEPLESLKKKDAYSYRDYLMKDKKAGKTINTKIACLKRLWNILVKRDIIKENPWTVLEKEKEIITKRNIAYAWEEVRQLSEVISVSDIELWRFVSIIYHTLARPNEIRQLQVYNVNLAKRKIYLDSFKTKSKRERWIDIHDGLIDTIIELVKNKSSKEYLFPGYEKGTCISKNKMTERHRQFLILLGFDDGYHTLYSWKHTGVIQAYEAGVDIKSIQRQCGHSSVLETDNYLKSLGLFDNSEIVLKQPTLPK